MKVIGCDPGLTGSLCLLDSQQGLLECVDVPTAANGKETGSMKSWVDTAALEALLADWSTRHDFARESVQAAIEWPIPMPTLPAQTIASQFDTFGVIRSMLASYADKVRYVNPQEWKRFYGLKHDKEEARACAQRLYSTAPLARKKDHNRADAVLIGHFHMREVA